MKVASKLFVSTHDEEYLNPNPPKREPAYTDRGTAIRIFRMPKPAVVDDIVYPQAVKFRNSLVDILNSGGFMPLSSEISLEGEVQILIECRDSNSPAIRTREGPPADSDNVIDFVRKKETFPITGPATIGAVVKELKLRESSYITLKNGIPATSDEPVSVNDEIVFMEVFSGG